MTLSNVQISAVPKNANVHFTQLILSQGATFDFLLILKEKHTQRGEGGGGREEQEEQEEEEEDGTIILNLKLYINRY